MSALSLLQQMQAYLISDVSLISSSIGVALPIDNSNLPIIAMSLINLQIPSVGLGQHTEVVSGALAVQTEIDLANPLLDDSSGFSLLSADRLIATLLHGGLVPQVTEAGQPDLAQLLEASDIQVAIDGNTLTLSQTAPNNGEFSVSATDGQLTFANPLPASGTLTANYFIGQWQRIIEQLSGEVETLVVGANHAETESLSNALIDSISSAHQNIAGLRQLQLSQLSSVNTFVFNISAIGDAPEPGADIASQRLATWRFTFENIINQPESSGGIIRGIILRTRRDSFPFEEEDIT
jgi:hypothetical protein